MTERLLFRIGAGIFILFLPKIAKNVKHRS